MIKNYFLVLVLCLFTTVNAQIITIPDANFKAKLLASNSTNDITKDINGNNIKIDKNSNGEIEVNEALNIYELNIINSNISNLSGIEFFTNLKNLDCGFNKLINLNVSALSNLKKLDCNMNGLISLNVNGLINLQKLGCPNNKLPNLNILGLNNLSYLHCGGNEITSLDLTGLSNLKELHCNNNQLSNLNITSLSNLQSLTCSKNQIQILDLSGSSNLNSLYCDNNKLANLNLSGMARLLNLYCGNNLLTSLNLTGLINLGTLGCENNQIPTLNLTGIGQLWHLNCGGNLLLNLNLSGLTNLNSLICEDNQLPTLNLTGLGNLINLNCRWNQLTSLDLTGLTKLQTLNISRNQLPNLNLSGLNNLYELDCYGNQLTSLNLTELINLQTLNCSSNQLISLLIKNGINESNLEFSNNPNLATICTDASQLSQVQLKLDTYGYTNCILTSDCNILDPIVTIPDAKFKAKLLAARSSNYTARDINGNYFKIDNNNDSEVQTSEALQVYNLNLESSSISSLQGISSFSNLEILNCNINEINSLDVSELIKITNLYCRQNKLSSLNLSGLANLQNLDCENNLLPSFDTSGLSKLENLYCANNQLTNLNVTGLRNLLSLECNENQLISLDLSGLDNLEYLACGTNRITSLNLAGLTKLSDFHCGNNQLTSLDVTGLVNLHSLGFYNNQISTIDLTGLSNLEELFAGQTPIESFDFSQMPNLQNLWIGYTPINSLDLSNLKKLTGINVSNCPNLESINLKNGSQEDLTYLETDLLEFLKIDGSNFYNCPKLQYICGDETELEAISQKIANYNYSNCVVGSYCSYNQGGANYTIQGNNRLDSNKNGCDASDITASNIKFNITDGTTAGTIISDETGNYSIKVQEGAYTITPVLENPNYFTISPTSVNVTFPTEMSPFIRDFCISPIGSHNDLEITLIPLEMARPGFDAKYKLIYKNKGTSIQAGSVNLTFNDAFLDLILSNPVVSSKNINNLSWNFSDLKPFDTREITFTVNVNAPTETPEVNNGDVLHYAATINSSKIDKMPNDNTFVFNQTVVGSYDPNDKTCLEGDVITPSLIGEYVHYLIRFENTGNYPAKNVVVKDMIDLSKFDISTLIPTDASDSYTTKISDGNKVEFIFENINLPYDDANNDGFIAFKIKTKPTLAVGDTFENEANIYFDYNFPILTNKATSTFKTLGTQDFEFSNYFSVYPIPVTTVLNIVSKNNVEVQSMAVYDILGQLVIAVPNAEKTTTIDVSKLTTGNYFIKIKSDKGTSSMKFIKN